MQPNIYLDIDGVILANERYAAQHADTFLEYVTGNFPTFWLTTHCRGDAEETIRHLARVLDAHSLELARRIQPTDWGELKTEAINFSQPFLWFDDDLFAGERAILQQHGVLGSWIGVNLAKDPHQLLALVRDFPIIQ